MSYTQTKIDTHRHEKMKALAEASKRSIIEEYRNALDYYIAKKTQEQMIEDSRLETFINERITKMENHLASMLGRTGMDTSMNLMGLIWLIDVLMKNVDRKDIELKIRKDGARYFSTAIQNDKANKKSSNE